MAKAIFVCVAVHALWAQGSVPADVKGWHGTEWGMEPGAVAKIIGAPLGEPVASDVAKREAVITVAERESANFDVIKEYKVRDVALGDWKVEGRFFFNEKGRTGLTTVSFKIGQAADFDQIFDQLKGQYGQPTSNKTTMIGTAQWPYYSWIFASTEIIASAVGGGKNPSLTFQRHTTL